MCRCLAEVGVRDISKASLELPREDSVLSANMNQTKRLDDYQTQSFPYKYCIFSYLPDILIEITRHLQCLIRLLHEFNMFMRDSVANGKITHKSQTEWADVTIEDPNTDVPYLCSPQQHFGQALLPMYFKQEESKPVLVIFMDALAMIKLLKDNSAKLKGGGIRILRLIMWNIAVLYTTYQLLFVIWIIISNEQVLNHDTCYCNNGEMMNCRFIAKLLKEVEYGSEVEECKNTDTIYLRSHAKEIQSRQILQSSFSATITCVQRFPSQPIERVPDIHEAAKFKRDSPAEYFDMIMGNFGIAVEAIRDTKHAKLTTIRGTNDYDLCNMSLHTYNLSHILLVGGYSDLQTTKGLELLRRAIDGTESIPWLSTLTMTCCCNESVALIMKTLLNCSVVMKDRKWLDCSVVMKDRSLLDCSDFMEDRTWLDCIVFMEDRKWLDCSVFMENRRWLDCSVVIMKDRTWLDCSDFMEDRKWLDCSVFMENRRWLDCSVVIMKDITWLDCSDVIMKDRRWLDCSVFMEDRRDETKEDLHDMFPIYTALISRSEIQGQNESNPALLFFENKISLAELMPIKVGLFTLPTTCNDVMDSFSEDVTSITATEMPISSSLTTGDTAVQKYGRTSDLSESISWDSIISLRTPDKHSQKCEREYIVHEIRRVEYLHKSIKDFFEINFTTFDQMEDDDETEQQSKFGIMQQEQSITEFNEHNVRDINLKNRKKSDFYSTIWQTQKPLPLPSLSRNVIVNFFDGQTTNELKEILTQLASDKIPETQTMMKFEMLRLCTMKQFPKDNRPFAIRIIEAGFYYGGYNDEVACYCCGSRKDNWILEDSPLLIHQILAPKCSFLINNTVVNIPIRKSNLPESTAVMRLLAIHRINESIPSDTTQGVSSLMPPSSEQNPMKISNEAFVTYESSPPIHLVSSEGQNVMDNQHTSIANNNYVKETEPKYPRYAEKSERINSFKGWPADLHQRPEEMAECGFYFAGFSDCVRCFHCGVGLRHWMREDDPWIEHARWSTSCFYVSKMKGEEFVSLVKMAVEIAEREETKQNDSRSNQPPTNNTETSTSDTVKKDSQDNKANDSAVPRESISSTGITCDPAGRAAASTAYPGNAEVQKYLLTDAAQSVLDMGYQPKLVQRAIEKILMKKGPDEMTGQIILEAVFEIEEEGSADSKSETPSQSAQQKERNEKDSGAAEGDSGHIDPEKIRREHRELSEATLCKICLDNTSSVVFLPCGHLVTCPECAPAMRKCPICRVLIKGTVKIFFG
ncbi:hypothetical protein ACJMK2_028863 [Sinanodonta woodiana]|uniref:RING-type domain-containing protein n=1 Tax=Sinanodonta woodiana TaxID=1069815 RepID=A0ABD3X8F4_SINWO